MLLVDFEVAHEALCPLVYVRGGGFVEGVVERMVDLLRGLLPMMNRR